jgi:N-acetylglucosamine kinase-like BadF-type ATPase
VSEEYFLGVDAGNSKTVALLADGRGDVRGWGRSGIGDVYGAPDEATAVAAVLAAIDQAVASAVVPKDAVVAAAFHLAGVDWPEDAVFWRAVLRAHLPHLPAPVVLNDGYALLRCRDPRGVGVAVSLGSGPAIAARGVSGSEFAMGFWCQHPLGGSGLGALALESAFLAELGMAPRTALSAPLCELLGASDIEDLLHQYTRRGSHLRRGAASRAARTVLRCAAQGDAVALGLLDDQAEHVVRYTCAIAGKVGLLPDGAPWKLSLGGSVMTSHEPELRERVLERAAEWLPSAEPEVIGVPPVLGVLLDAYASLDRDRASAVHRAVLGSSLPPEVFAT